MTYGGDIRGTYWELTGPRMLPTGMLTFGGTYGVLIYGGTHGGPTEVIQKSHTWIINGELRGCPTGVILGNLRSLPPYVCIYVCRFVLVCVYVSVYKCVCIFLCVCM